MRPTTGKGLWELPFWELCPSSGSVMNGGHSYTLAHKLNSLSFLLMPETFISSWKVRKKIHAPRRCLQDTGRVATSFHFISGSLYLWSILKINLSFITFHGEISGLVDASYSSQNSKYAWRRKKAVWDCKELECD